MSNRPTARRGSARSAGHAGSSVTKRRSRTKEQTAKTAGLADSGESRGFASASRKRPRLLAVLLGIVLLAALVLAALFCWDRWLRYDDTADIQGIWKDEAGNVQVAIDSSRMLLGQNLVYDYSIDTQSKTITYRYQDSQGTSAYRFGADRNTLVLDESGQTDWLVALHLRQDPLLTGDVAEGCTRLTRMEGYAQDVFTAYDTSEAVRQSAVGSAAVGKLPLYDAETGMFYDAATGYAYDSELGVFVDAETGWGYDPADLGYDQAALEQGLSGNSSALAADNGWLDLDQAVDEGDYQDQEVVFEDDSVEGSQDETFGDYDSIQEEW